MRKKMIFQCGALGALLPLAALNDSLSAQTLEMAIGFGIKDGSSSLYAFTASGSHVIDDSLIGASPSGMNHVATDINRRRVYYTANGNAFDNSLGIVTNLYAYDFNANRSVNLGSLGFSGAGAGSSGGATFYQGNYYLWNDSKVSGVSGLHRVAFDGSGNVSSVDLVYNAFETPLIFDNDLGDIAINSNGEFFMLGRTFKHLLTGNLADMISNGTALTTTQGHFVNGTQLLNTPDGKIATIGSSDPSGFPFYSAELDGAIYNINIGNPNSSGVLTADGGAIARVGAGPWADLTSGGFVIAVPEPSTALLGSLSLGLLALRRRR